MAPDAEKTKRRLLTDNDDIADVDTSAIVDVLAGDEVSIDGNVYTLKGFDHPGGDQIKLFGGNDVTVQYKMIHPRHTAQHLSKMTILRKLKNPHCE